MVIIMTLPVRMDYSNSYSSSSMFEGVLNRGKWEGVFHEFVDMHDFSYFIICTIYSGWICFLILFVDITTVLLMCSPAFVRYPSGISNLTSHS